MRNSSQMLDSIIIQYAQSCMEGGEVTVKEYNQLKHLVSLIISRYYPNWDSNNG